ncbi:MAG TPA: TPM domain-containing protein [Candidatus Dormibacteraeota bacterium]|nr:TPM domain-containing protein [Candidatus Dormibacteraeota bacterium]
MKLARLLRHLLSTRWSTRRHFTPAVRAAIEQAVKECEAYHAGEIRFVVETAFDVPELWHDLAPRQRALQLFGQLGVWDTAHNNGVMIYVLMADRVVEIVADRGIAARVTAAEWQGVCREMQQHYRAGHFREGSLAGVAGVGVLLGRHFPGHDHGAQELPDQPVLL